MKNVRVLVTTSFLIALEIILTRFLSIKTPIVRIGFGFLPIAFIGMLYGPIVGGIAGAVSDILGMLIFPQGAYFPGFTLTAFISGAVYGIFLYKKPDSLVRLIVAVLVNTIFADLILNSIWLTMITGKGIYAILPTRIISNAAMLPIKVFTISVCWRLVGSHIPRENLIYNK